MLYKTSHVTAVYLQYWILQRQIMGLRKTPTPTLALHYDYECCWWSTGAPLLTHVVDLTGVTMVTLLSMLTVRWPVCRWALASSTTFCVSSRTRGKSLWRGMGPLCRACWVRWVSHDTWTHGTQQPPWHTNTTRHARLHRVFHDQVCVLRILMLKSNS